MANSGLWMAVMTDHKDLFIPAIIDIEASGLGAGSYPIEVGYVLADGSSWCCLIQPDSSWTRWSDDAEALHGISRQILKQYGQGVREVAERLNRELQGLTLYSDAWGNDQSWLQQLFEHAELVPRFRLETIRYLLDEEQAAIWQLCKLKAQQQLGVQRHRASADARLIQRTYLLCQQGKAP